MFVERRGGEVEGEGKKSRVRVKSRGLYEKVEGHIKKSRVVFLRQLRQLLTIKEFLKRSVENFGVKKFSAPYVNHELREN